MIKSLICLAPCVPGPVCEVISFPVSSAVNRSNKIKYVGNFICFLNMLFMPLSTFFLFIIMLSAINIIIIPIFQIKLVSFGVR